MKQIFALCLLVSVFAFTTSPVLAEQSSADDLAFEILERIKKKVDDLKKLDPAPVTEDEIYEVLLKRADLTDGSIDCDNYPEIVKQLKRLYSRHRFSIMGVVEEFGLCGPANRRQAHWIYWEAVQENADIGYLGLGRHFTRGDEYDRDEEEARYWFRKWILHNRTLTSKDRALTIAKIQSWGFESGPMLEEAIDWFLAIPDLPADQQYDIAVRLINGDGLPQNRRYALSLLMDLANGGHRDAQFRLAKEYLNRTFRNHVTMHDSSMHFANSQLSKGIKLDDLEMMKFSLEKLRNGELSSFAGRICALAIRIYLLENDRMPATLTDFLSCQRLKPEAQEDARQEAKNPLPGL